MKKILFSAAAVLGTAVYGQVGINTTSPKATFEVNGQPTVATVPDGVIPPQLTREQLIAKTAYSTNQKGAMVYVTDTTGTTNTATAKVDKAGYYYFDGFIWQKAGGDDWSLTGNEGTDSSVNFIGTLNDQSLSFVTFQKERWRITRGGRLVNAYHIPASPGVLSTIFIGGAETGSFTTGNDSAMTSFGNIGIGFGTLGRINTTAQLNTVIGYDAAYTNIVTGSRNAGYGAFSLSNLTSGSNNAAFGADSLNGITTGSNNSGIGRYALGAVTTGNNNIGFGESAGKNITTGSNNIVIGYNTVVPSETASNQLTIGNSIFGININDGNDTNDLIGIGVKDPQTALDVYGNIRTRVLQQPSQMVPQPVVT